MLFRSTILGGGFVVDTYIPPDAPVLAQADVDDVYLSVAHEKAEKTAEVKQAQAIRRTDVFRTQRGRKVIEHRQTVEVVDANGNGEVCAGGDCAGGNCSAGNCSAGACTSCQTSTTVRKEKRFVPEDDGSGQYSGACSSGSCGSSGRMRRGLFGRMRGGCGAGGCN